CSSDLPAALLLPLHQVPRPRDHAGDRRRPLPGPQEGAPEGRARHLLPDPRDARPEEEALDVRAPRLAQAAAGGGHPARGAPVAGQQVRHPAAAWRAAQERAGRAPVRAPRVHGAAQSLTAPARRPGARREGDRPMTVDRDDWPPAPLTLVGRHVRLEPLDETHGAELLDAAADGQLWDLWYTTVPGPENVDDWIADALDQRDEGRALPFVVRRIRDERLVGSTRYMNIEPRQRRLEIGTTWYSASVQRTALNTEC